MGQVLATVVVRRTGLAVVALLVLLAAPSSDAQTSGSAPVNWGDDPSSVALWTFNGNANNVSNSRTYCAAGEADLTRQVIQGGGLTFDTANRREGSASVSLDRATTLAAQSSINQTRCLRQNSPNQWTITFWMRNTARNANTSSPFPVVIFNRDEAAIGPEALNGFYVMYANDRGSAQGQTYACMRATNDGSDNCTGFYPGAFAPSTNWHFGAVQYTGRALRYALEAAAFPAGVTQALGKNPGTYPFQLSHIVQPGNNSGVIGNEDEVWWTAVVLTQQQVCRVRSVGVQGTLGWCAPDGTHWMACNSDVDCGERAGSCNTAFAGVYPQARQGTCVGYLGKGVSAPAGCQAVADIGPCNANLTGAVPPPSVTTMLPVGSNPSSPALLSVEPVP
jgi:hypothetical protein